MIDEVEDYTEVVVDHYEIAEEEDEDYEFQFCIDDSEYFDVLKELKENIDEDDIEIKINCPFEGCRRSFTRQHNLMKHFKSHELGIDKAGSICHICGKYIKGVYSLHLKTHEELKPFHCDECGKEFRQKIALNNHMLIHRDEKPFPCPHCLKCFRQKYTMQHHIRNRHNGVKDHICELCGKECADRATLQKHMLVHSTTKPYQCLTCFMSFRHKSSLSRHNKIHLKITECPQCNKVFRYESFLKKHLMTAHCEDQVEYSSPKKEEEEPTSVIYETENQTQVIHQVVDEAVYYTQPVSFSITDVHSYAS